MSFKKYLPFIIIIVAAVVLVGGFLIVKKITQPVSTDMSQDDGSVADLPQDQKPVAALVPTSDGHYLTLKVDGIKVPNATSMDYDLLWKANNSGTLTPQGTSSTVQLNGQTSFKKDLLLGSESNGKFRYDKGVENGTLTLRFRNSNGKLLGKVTTDFHLQTGTTNLSSVDGSFKYTLSKIADGVWFVTMQTFGNPNPSSFISYFGNYSIIASDGRILPVEK